MYNINIKTLFSNKNRNVFLIEFISTFMAVILAFALNNWNDNRKTQISENKIIDELKIGMIRDKVVLEYNRKGHQDAIDGIQEIRKLINNEEYSKDSILDNYDNVFQAYTFTTSNTAYNSMMTRGLEIIKDDDLRIQTSYFYEYYFDMVEKSEETLAEHQFYQNYFFRVNEKLLKYMQYDENNQLKGFVTPIQLSSMERKTLYNYLYEMEKNRKEQIGIYDYVIEEFEDLETFLEVK